jgi:hypothetical protein
MFGSGGIEDKCRRRRASSSVEKLMRLDFWKWFVGGEEVIMRLDFVRVEFRSISV